VVRQAVRLPRRVGGKLTALRRTIGTVLSWAWEASPLSVVIVMSTTVVTGLLAPAQLGLTRELIDGIVDSSTRRQGLGPLIPIVAAMSLVTVGSRVLTTLLGTRQQVLGERVNRVAQTKFYRKTVDVDLVRFDDPGWYDLYQRSVQNLNFRPIQLTMTMASLVGSIVTIGGMLGVLLSLHPFLAVLGLLSVVPDLFVQRRSTKLFYADDRDHVVEARDITYTGSAVSQPTLAAEVRSFNIGPHLLARFNTLSNVRLARRARMFTRIGMWQGGAGLASGLMLALCFGFLAQRGAAGDLSPGAAAALVGALTSITTNVSGVSRELVTIEQHATFLADLLAFLEVPRVLPQPATPRRLPGRLDDGIRFEGVRFAYPVGGVQALDGFDLHVRSGEMLALVGDNGAGKSTIVKLLHRFYDPDEGRITVGGVDLREADVNDVRSRIGSLLQDFGRYQLTVRENITLGRIEQEVDDRAVHEALEAARATSVLSTLPDGLDGRVGQQFGGHELSGGQWQRLALARLMYRNADVWILDEPTAAMDPEAEAAIFSELREQLQGRIGIVISHRFSTVRIADRIGVLSGGRVTELGTHEELLALGGRYSELFELQAAGYR
jgi:ABC-type multidrug transport system fused ATPase/permease subunit